MAEKAHLQTLAANVQTAVDAFDPTDRHGWMAVSASLEKLRLAVEPPHIVTSKKRYQPVENVCVMMAEEMGVLDALCKYSPSSLTAADISHSTGYDTVLVARLMRMMTALGFADEISFERYKANAVTACQNDIGGRGSFYLINDTIFALADNIRHYVRTNRPCKLGVAPSPFEAGTGLSLWAKLKADPHAKKSFDDTMTSRNKLFAVAWHVKFPAAARLAGRRAPPVVVDIGGSQGIDLQRLGDTHPELGARLVLQDLPETLAGLPEPRDKRIEAIAYDFFTPQPVIGADIYYFKSVLHNWQDADGTRILSNTARAMAPESLLLINDMVLGDVGESLTRADMDMMMLMLCNSLERTEAQWRALLASTSPPLKLVKVWSVPGDDLSVIEACLA